MALIHPGAHVDLPQGRGGFQGVADHVGYGYVEDMFIHLDVGGRRGKAVTASPLVLEGFMQHV